MFSPKIQQIFLQHFQIYQQIEQTNLLNLQKKSFVIKNKRQKNEKKIKDKNKSPQRFEDSSPNLPKKTSFTKFYYVLFL